LLASAIVIFTAVTVLFGWYLTLPAIVQIHPTFVPMQFNTALCFLLSGAALFSYLQSRLALTRLFASGALLLAGLTGLQMLLGLNFHLDQLFMEHYVTVKTVSPGRMEPNTSLCFVLISTNLLILSSPLSDKIRSLFASIVSPLVTALAAIALLGYLIGA
jgi:hypothetical protein